MIIRIKSISKNNTTYIIFVEVEIRNKVIVIQEACQISIPLLDDVDDPVIHIQTCLTNHVRTYIDPIMESFIGNQFDV